MPTLDLPTDALYVSTETPTLSATFGDPDTQDTGTVTFQVCSSATCTGGSDPLATFDSSSTTVGVGSSGSAAVPAGTITADGTYYWRAKSTDSASSASSYSATRSFIVDTTAPANARAVYQAHREKLPNFSMLVSHVLVPPTLALDRK